MHRITKKVWRNLVHTVAIAVSTGDLMVSVLMLVPEPWADIHLAPERSMVR